MKNQHLFDLNKQLIVDIKYLSDTYFLVREEGKGRDFFSEVKPFCDRVKNICDQWLPLAKDWVVTYQPKHLHPVQLEHTAENLQMVSVRAFYPETSRKQFINHIHSIEYVLLRLEDEIQTLSCS